MKETYRLKVHLACDEETGRWYIAESDIPGLWLEADTPLELMAKIEQAAPEMIELNRDEIVAACRARAAADEWQKAPKGAPQWLPIFDSPLKLAHA